MKFKKVPMRMCLGCRESKPKKEILRIVKNKENVISIDDTGKAHGRGAYVCKRKSCLEKTIKGRKLEKVFEKAIDPGLYDMLRMRMEDVDEE